MSEHPRALNSGQIPCANCGERLEPSAPFCAHCTYPWPLAQDRNRVICPDCQQSVVLFARRPDPRTNRWDRVDLCVNCGAPEPWRNQSVEAQKQPPPSIQERVTGIAILVIVGIIISYVLG